MAENIVKVRLGIDADVTAAKKAISSLEASLTNLRKAQASRGFEDFGLNEAVQNAKVLESSLNRAFNQNTNKLDLSVLNKNLREAGTSVNEISAQFLRAGTAGQQAFMSLATAVAHTEIPLKTANKLVQSFARTLKNTAQYQISATLYQGVTRAISDAISYTKNLNSSLNDIRIVTGQSAAEMAKFAQAANASAQKLSTTTNSYAKASLIFYQQGLSDAEVKKRTDAVIKMANVTKENMEDVSSYMTAVWNNFDDGTKSLEHYADVMTALGAATASSTKEIAAGLEKFASIGKTIGLSYDYATSALATIVSKTRQSADTVGTGLRTIFSRLQGLSLGETLEDGVNLNKYSSALKAVGVNILDVSGNMRDMDAILESLAGKWQNLSTAQKTALAQTVGGVRQYTTLISLMDNWGSMEQNLNTAKGADGALQKQQDIYAESWEAAASRSKAAVEELFSTLLNDKGFIKMTNGLTAVTKAFTALANGLGGLPGILSTIGMVATKVFSQQITSSISDSLLKLNTWAGQFEGKNFLGKIGAGAKGILTGKTKSYAQVNAEKEIKSTRAGYEKTMSQLEASGKKDSAEYYSVEAANKLLTAKQQLIATESTLTAAQKARAQADITAMAEEQAAVFALRQEKEALSKAEKKSSTADIKNVIRAGSAQKGTRRDGTTFVRSNDAAANWILSRAAGYNASNGVQGLLDLRQKQSNAAYQTTMANKYSGALKQMSPNDTKGREQIMASINKTFGEGTVTKIEDIEKALQKIINKANAAEKEIQDVIDGAKGADLEAGNALEDYVGDGRSHGESQGMIDWEEAVRTNQIPTQATTAQQQEAQRRAMERAREEKAAKIAGGMQKASQATMSFTAGLSQASTLMATLGDESASTAEKITSSMSVASSAVSAFATGGILGGVAYLAGFALTAGLDAIDKAYHAEEIAADQAQADAEALQENYKSIQESYDNLLSTFDSYKEGSQTLDSLITGTDEWKEALIQANEAALQLINNLGLVEGQDYTIGTNGEITFTKDGQNRIDQAQSDKLQEALTAQSAANLAQAEAANARAIADLDVATKSNDKGRWATAAGLAATGAGLGAWGGTALGTIVPVIGNVIGGVAGAIIGGVGGLLGGLVAYDATIEKANKAERDKVDAIVKKYEDSNGTMTDSKLKELIGDQFTGESESYKKSIFKVVKSTVEANKQLNDAMKLAAQNVLNANEIYNSITNEDAQTDISKRASKIYADAANAAGDKFDSTTDEETRKKWAQDYADILTAGKQGVDIQYNDDGSFTYSYIGDDGHVTEDFKVTESMLRTWYKSSQGDAAVNAQVEDLSEVYTDLREGNIEGISKSSQNAIASMSARDNLNDMTGEQINNFSAADLEALTQDQLTALGFVDLADAKAKAGKMRKAYVEEWNALAEEHKASGFYGNYQGTGDLSLHESMSLNAFKNFDNMVNEMEKGPIADIGKKLNLGIEKAFEEANVSEEDRTALLDQISQIDWSDYDAFEQFEAAFESMGYSIDTASGGWNEFITQMRQASGAIPDFTSLKNNLSSMAKITKDLKLGDIVSEEDYDTLVKINDAYADLFILQADGSRKFIGDADAMREATKTMALEQKELLDSYKAVADIEDVVKFNWDNVKGESVSEDFNKLYADNEALQTMLTNAGYTKEIIDEIFKEAANGDTSRLEAMFDLVQKATNPAQMAVATQELEEMIASTATTIEELQSMLANNTISQETYSKSLIALASGYEYCAEAVKKYQDALATGDKDLIKDAEESLTTVIELEKEASKYEDAFSHALSGKSSVSVNDLVALKEISPELYSGYSTMSEDEWYRASHEAYSQWLETRIAGYSEDSAAYKVLMAEKTQLDAEYNQHLAEITEKAAEAQQEALKEYIDTIQDAIDELSSLDLSGEIGSFSFAELDSFRQAIEAAGLDYDAFMEKISPKNHATNKDAILALADAQTQLELLGHTAKIEQLQNAQNVISPTVRANIEPPLETNGEKVGVTTVDGVTTVSVNPINYGLFFNEDGTLIEKYGNANYTFYLKPPTGTGGGVTVSGDIITGLEPLEGKAGYVASIVQDGNDAKVTVTETGITVTDAYGKANISVKNLTSDVGTVSVTSDGISLNGAKGNGTVTVADLVGNNTTLTVDGDQVKIKDANGKGSVSANLISGNNIDVGEDNSVTITASAQGTGSVKADLDSSASIAVGDNNEIEIVGTAEGSGKIKADLDDGTNIQVGEDNSVTITAEAEGSGKIKADLDDGNNITVGEGNVVEITAEAEGSGKIKADLDSGANIDVGEDNTVAITAEAEGSGTIKADLDSGSNIDVGEDNSVTITAEAEGSGTIKADLDDGNNIKVDENGEVSITAKAEGSGTVSANLNDGTNIEVGENGEVSITAEAEGSGTVKANLASGTNVSVDENGVAKITTEAEGSGTVSANLVSGTNVNVDENGVAKITTEAEGSGTVEANLVSGTNVNVDENGGVSITSEAEGSGTVKANLGNGNNINVDDQGVISITGTAQGSGTISANLGSGKNVDVTGNVVSITGDINGQGTITADLTSGGDFTLTEGAFVYTGAKNITGNGNFQAEVSLSKNAAQTNVSVSANGTISLVNNKLGLDLKVNPNDGKTTGVQVLNDGTIALHGLDSINKEILMSLGIDPNSAFKFENGVLTLPPFELPTLTQTIELQYLEKRDSTLVKELNTLQSIVKGRDKGLITGSGVDNKTGALIANDNYTRFYGDAGTGWAARMINAGSIDEFMNSSIMYNGRTNRQDFLVHANAALTEASGVIDLSDVGEDEELTKQFLQSDMWQTAKLIASIGDEAGIDLYDMFAGGYTDKNKVFHSQDEAYQDFIDQFGQMMGLVGIDNWTNEDRILGQDIIGRFIQNGDYENGLEWLFSLLPEDATEADLEKLILNTLGYKSIDDFFKVWDVDAFDKIATKKNFSYSSSGNFGRAHSYATRMDDYGAVPLINFAQEGLDYRQIYEQYYKAAFGDMNNSDAGIAQASVDWLINNLAGAQTDDLDKIAQEHLREAFGDPDTWTADIFNDADFDGILKQIYALFQSEDPQMQALGQYLWQGLTKGIYDESGNLIGTVSEGAQTIITTIAEAWGIASPSKVARQLGRYFMQGLNLGFSDIKVNIGPLSKTIIEAVQRELDVTSPIVSNMVKTGLSNFTFAEWGENFTLTNEDGTLKDLTGDSFTQIRGYVVDAINSILGTEYTTWEEVIDEYGNGADLEAALKAKDSNVSLSGLITKAKANETTAANKAWLDKQGYKFATYQEGENAGKWYVAHNGDILEDFGVKDSEADIMQAVLESEAYIKEMQNGVAKYMDGEFWSDKTLNLMEKAVYNTIAKEALEKLGAESFEQYLANGGSVEEMFAQIDAAYNNHVAELSGDVSQSWASIKDNYIKVIQECMKEDEKAANETITRWTSAWEAIGEIRKAILSGDIKDTSISEILGNETQREAYIRSLIGKGTYYQNGAFDFNNMYAHLIGYNQADLNGVALGSYQDSGLNKVNGIQFLNTNAEDGRVINTTLDQFLNNRRTQMIATNAAYLADSEYVGSLTNTNLFTPLYGEGTNVSDIYTHMAQFQDWQNKNGQKYETQAAMEEAFLTWGIANGLFKDESTAIYQLGQGHTDKFTSYFNMMNSLIDEGLLIAGEDGNYTWKNGMTLTGEVIATDQYNATYGNQTAEQQQTDYVNANVAAMLAQTGYYNDYVAQMQDEFDTRSKALEDKQKLVQRALNGEELNTSEQAELDKIMAEGGYSTLEEANVGLASEMDACAAAVARFAKALSLGYIPDGNGNFVKTTTKSAGFTGSYETEEAAKEVLGNNNEVWTQDAEKNWSMQRVVQTGEGENAVWKIETVTLDTETMTVDSPQYVALSSEKADNAEAAHLANAQAAGFASVQEQNDYIAMMETAGDDTDNYSDGGMLTAEEMMNQSKEDEIDTLEKAIEKQKEYAKQLKVMEEGLSELNSSGKEWIKTLKSENSSLDAKVKALNNLRKSYQKVLGLTNEQMGLLGDDFLKDEKNLDLVTKAATKTGKEGAEALDELQVAAAKAIDPFDALDTSLDEVITKLSQLKLNAGELLSDKDASAAETYWDAVLNRTLEGSKGVVSAVEAANASLNSLGIDVEPQFEVVTETMDAATFATRYAEAGEKNLTITDPATGAQTVVTATNYQQIIDTYGDSIPVTYVKGKNGKALSGSDVAGLTNNYRKNAEKTGGGGGGGGGGGARRRYLAKAKPEDHKERYHEVNAAIDDVSDALERLNEQQDRAWGSARIKAMQEESKILREQTELYRKKAKEAEGYLNGYYDSNGQWVKGDRQRAEEAGWIIDENGRVSNYEERLDDIINDYNSKIMEYNAMSAQEQETLEKLITEANERFEKGDASAEQYLNPETGVAFGSYEEYLKYTFFDAPQKALETYEGTMEEWEDIQKSILTNLYTEYDNYVEQIKYTAENMLEFIDDQIAYIEHKLSRMEDNAYKTAESIELIASQIEASESKIAVAEQELATLLGAHDINVEDFLSGKVSADDLKNAGFTESEIEELRNIMTTSQDAEKEMSENLTKGIESMSTAFESFNQELDRYTSSIEHAQSITSTYRNILDLTGKSLSGFSVELLKAFNESTIEQAQANMSANKTKYETVQVEYDKALQVWELAQAQYAAGLIEDSAYLTAKKTFEDTEDALQEAQESYIASWEAAIQAVADAYQSTMEAVIEDVSKKLANGMTGGLDALSEYMDRAKTAESNYVDDYEKIYQLTKLTRDLDSKIDNTQNVKTQKELLKFQKEINELLQSDKQLSEYDIDYLQKKYDLKLAEIALEDAQNAKSQVTMRRDSEGNYNYVYTADENAVADAEAEYEGKLYEMQKANDEYITSLSDNIISLEQEMLQAIGALDPAQFASEEDYNNRVADIIKFYTEQMEYQSSEMGKVLANNKSLYDNDMKWYAEYRDYKMADAATFLDSWDKILLAQVSGFSTQEEFFNNFKQQAGSLANESLGAYATWAQKIAEINTTAGTSTGTLGEDIGKKVQQLTDDAKEAAEKMETSAGKIKESVAGITGAVTDMLDKFEGRVGAAADKVDLLTLSIMSLFKTLGVDGFENLQLDGKLSELWLKIQATENAKPTATTSEDGPDTGYDTGGYTGSWGTEGRLAFLHQKELVLNAHDTENMLASVGILRQIANVIDLNALTSAGGFANLISSGISHNREPLQQEVHIEAHFPNATDKNQIEEAFKDIVNLASQYANSF